MGSGHFRLLSFELRQGSPQERLRRKPARPERARGYRCGVAVRDRALLRRRVGISRDGAWAKELGRDGSTPKAAQGWARVIINME